MTAPALALAALVAGILAGEHAGAGEARAALFLAALLLVLAFVVRGPRAAAIAIVACGLLGAAVTQRALRGLEVSPLAGPVAARARVVANVTLADDPSGPRFVARVLVRVARVDGRTMGERTVLVVAGGDVASRLRVLASGDRVTLAGSLGPLAGHEGRFRWQHAVGTLHADEVLSFAGPASPLARLANALRAAVVRGAEGLPATERGLLAGFLLGDTRAVPDELVADFRNAGLSHLLAVSGANVAFVLALVAPVLRRLGLAGRLAGGLAVLVVFGTMTRWEPSVLRASVMAGTTMLAVFLGRPASAGRVLVMAVAALLVADPFLLHSVGFLLSCGACAGIALFAPGIAAGLAGPRSLREALGVTAAAQVGVAPVLLPVFGTVPLVSLPANLVAVPVVGPLTVWGLVAGVAGGLVGRDVANLLQLPTLALLRWVETVARVAGGVPLAVDVRGVWGLAALGCVIGLLRAWRAGPFGRLRRDGRRVRGEGERPGPPSPRRAGARRRAPRR